MATASAAGARSAGWRSWVRQLAWPFFALEVLLILGWAERVDLANPSPIVSASTSPSGVRFGLTEAQRRAMFQEALRGEPIDRVEALKISETAVWNRNHDDFFHEREWRRVARLASIHRIPEWQMFLVLDEGMRAHWPPPPGVDIYDDEAPLARTTRPIQLHRLMLKGPPLPPPPPTATPAPAPAPAPMLLTLKPAHAPPITVKPTPASSQKRPR